MTDVLEEYRRINNTDPENQANYIEFKSLGRAERVNRGLKPTLDIRILKQRQAILSELLTQPELKRHLREVIAHIKSEEKRTLKSFLSGYPKYRGGREHPFLGAISQTGESLRSLDEVKELKRLAKYSPKQDLYYKMEIENKRKAITYFRKRRKFLTLGEREITRIEETLQRWEYRLPGFDNMATLLLRIHLDNLVEDVNDLIQKIARSLEPYLTSVDELEVDNKKTKADYTDDKKLRLTNIFHPRYRQSTFKPLSVTLDQRDAGAIITGANGGGKTTLIEVISSAVNDAITTGFVTADSAKLGWLPPTVRAFELPYEAKYGTLRESTFRVLTRALFEQLSTTTTNSIFVIDSEFDGTTNEEGLLHLYETFTSKARERGIYLLATTHLLASVAERLPESFARIGITKDHQVRIGEVQYDSTAIEIIDRIAN